MERGVLCRTRCPCVSVGRRWGRRQGAGRRGKEKKEVLGESGASKTLLLSSILARERAPPPLPGPPRLSPHSARARVSLPPPPPHPTTMAANAQDSQAPLRGNEFKKDEDRDDDGEAHRSASERVFFFEHRTRTRVGVSRARARHAAYEYSGVTPRRATCLVACPATPSEAQEGGPRPLR